METPPNARQVTQDADWWEAEQAARDVRWQTSIEDFRRLVATAEETVASARETARATETARHRVISTCYLGEYAAADVTGAHLRYMSAAAALAAQDTQNAALAAQEAYDMVTAACARAVGCTTSTTRHPHGRGRFTAGARIMRSARRSGSAGYPLPLPPRCCLRGPARDWLRWLWRGPVSGAAPCTGVETPPTLPPPWPNE